ncbi:hypothetical protein HZS_4514, partial [Henneguya salminicola]
TNFKYKSIDFEINKYSKMQRETIVAFNGFNYTISNSTKKMHHYRCSQHRSTLCKARLQIEIQSGNHKISGASYSCKAAKFISPEAVDVRDEMKARAAELTLASRGLSAKRLWHDISNEIDKAYTEKARIIKKLSRRETANIIENARR